MIQKATNKPAAAYLRRSTDKQPQSIEDQKSELRRYADEHGFTIIAEYTDDAKSGTSVEGRDGFLRMIADAERPNRPFQFVLVYDVKRLGRTDMDEAGYYRYRLRQCGVEVVYVAEGFTGRPSDDVQRFMKQYLAREESRGLSLVTIRGQLSSVKEGWWSGGMPPYGYDLEYVGPSGEVLNTVRYLETGEKAVFDLDGRAIRTLSKGQRHAKGDGDKTRLVLSLPERVELVKEIFKMYVDLDMGFKAIANNLNERHIPSPKNGKYSSSTYAGWSTSTVRSIIMNRQYTGDMVWNRRTSAKFHRIADERAVEYDNGGKRSLAWNDEDNFIVVPDTHPAIIDRETFEKGQRLQGQRGGTHYTVAHRSGRSKTSQYLLSGLIKCACCGHSFSGIGTPKGKPRKDGTKVKTY